ncbi:maleylpyruvate isomerase family mycothiol-dependent enzyme [Planomonospora sp. ID67723]|uniref:maleylpyruvate isomerase family mycothiol-dependent enzyme n=1 Tax=Planomonospora sp. ID67723 TaxID=2738134 RepID=UPI0018C3F609|nr:maleylpyruvate isomerase family mycothiol-dependent enzyme [Planomonospora sp. ID67723]MBG0832783.1 maleylpyruvate isomerase family mycothiol-dependent enzyme [Planomonospora sp. ID67723]
MNNDPTRRLYLDALAESLEEIAVEAPKASLRPLTLTAARVRRRPAASVSGWTAPFAGRIAAMDALLGEVGEQDWGRETVEGWTLQELLAHLAAKDGLVALSVGAPVLGPPVTVDEALARTAELQEYERRRVPEQTRRDWRAQADALCRHLAPLAPGAPVEVSGFTLPARDHLLARALETWIHTSDAAGVAGLRVPDPVPEHITATADLCVRLMPLTMLASGHEVPEGRAVRLVLTGPGGGRWHVPLHPGGRAARGDGPADATVTCDVVEFCFLVGGRAAPAGLAAEVEGDPGLARDLLHAAPALSGP